MHAPSCMVTHQNNMQASVRSAPRAYVCFLCVNALRKQIHSETEHVWRNSELLHTRVHIKRSLHMQLHVCVYRYRVGVSFPPASSVLAPPHRSDGVSSIKALFYICVTTAEFLNMGFILMMTFRHHVKPYFFKARFDPYKFFFFYSAQIASIT